MTKEQLFETLNDIEERAVDRAANTIEDFAACHLPCAICPLRNEECIEKHKTCGSRSIGCCKQTLMQFYKQEKERLGVMVNEEKGNVKIKIEGVTACNIADAALQTGDFFFDETMHYVYVFAHITSPFYTAVELNRGKVKNFNSYDKIIPAKADITVRPLQKDEE